MASVYSFSRSTRHENKQERQQRLRQQRAALLELLPNTKTLVVGRPIDEDLAKQTGFLTTFGCYLGYDNGYTDDEDEDNSIPAGFIIAPVESIRKRCVSKNAAFVAYEVTVSHPLQFDGLKIRADPFGEIREQNVKFVPFELEDLYLNYERNANRKFY